MSDPTLRNSLIRLAHSSDSAGRAALLRVLTAGTYKDYLDKLPKGKKPMEREPWEKQFGGGGKDEEKGKDEAEKDEGDGDDKKDGKGWGSGQRAKAEDKAKAAEKGMAEAKKDFKRQGGWEKTPKKLRGLGQSTEKALDKALADVKKALSSGADVPPESILDAAKAFDEFQKAGWKAFDAGGGFGSAGGFHDDSKAVLKKLQKVSDIWGTESWGDKATNWFKGIFSKKGSARSAGLRPLPGTALRNSLIRLAHSQAPDSPERAALVRVLMADGGVERGPGGESGRGSPGDSSAGHCW